MVQRVQLLVEIAVTKQSAFLIIVYVQLIHFEDTVVFKLRSIKTHLETLYEYIMEYIYIYIYVKCICTPLYLFLYLYTYWLINYTVSNFISFDNAFI